MIEMPKLCPLCGAIMDKDNTLEWLRDAEDRIVVAAVFCLSCKRAVWREGEGEENGGGGIKTMRMSPNLKPCPFCGTLGAVYTFRFKMLCVECGAEGPRGRDACECEANWNERSDWMQLREAVKIPSFRCGIKYPLRVPNVAPEHRYGHWVIVKEKPSGTFYYLNGWACADLDYQCDYFEGETTVGDLLVLRSDVLECVEGGER